MKNNLSLQLTLKGREARRKYKNSVKGKKANLKYNNSEKGRKANLKYNSSETGYFMRLWHNVKNSTHGNEFKNYEEFFQCWTDQQKIYGTKCPYTGVEMTRIILGNKKGSQVRINTNISKDRIKSNFPYSKKNLMFVTWKINLEKGAITTKTAESFLKFERERFGTLYD